MRSDSKYESIHTRRQTITDPNADNQKFNVPVPSHKKKHSYNFFGCCFKSQDYVQPADFPAKRGIGRPAANMNLKNDRNNLLAQKRTTDTGGCDYDVEPLEVDIDLIVKEYPADIVFILGERYKIVAKITTTRVSKMTSVYDEETTQARKMRQTMRSSVLSRNSESEKDSQQRDCIKSVKPSKLSSQAKKELFSKYDKGIKCEGWEEVTPEKIALHVACRIKCDTIFDALCGYGASTIQFARTCNYVIANDINLTKTLWAKHNSKVYKVDNQIDFLNSDFMTLRNISADVVFLDPSDDRQSKAQNFSIFKNVKPDPLTLLAKSLEVSCKIVLQLPGDTDIEELPQLIHQSLEKYGSYSKRFCIEIEKIMNCSNEIEKLIIYFGDSSVINPKQEYQAIYDYITRKETHEWKQKFPFRVIAAVVEKVGIRRSFEFIYEIEEELNRNRDTSKSVFEVLLEKVVQKNILNKAALNRMIEEESFLAEPFGASPQSLATQGTVTTRGFMTYMNSESKIRRPDSLEESNDLGKYFKDVQTNSSNPRMNGSSQGLSLLTGKLLKNKSSPPPKTEKKNSPPESPLVIENTYMKNSYDMSDLAVSSYSVSSSYLRDFSEDEAPSRKTLGNASPTSESSSKTNGEGLIKHNGRVAYLSRKKNKARADTLIPPTEDHSEMMLVVDKYGNKSFKRSEEDPSTLSKSQLLRRKTNGEIFKSVGEEFRERDLGYNQSYKFESDDEKNY